MNVLAFFAHPDDETMLAGGTFTLLAQQGAEVDFLSATRGEGGEVGNPPLTTQEELGKIREQELFCAIQALGGKRLSFLSYIDPRVGTDDALFAYTESLENLIGEIQIAIQQFSPDVFITHGSNGEYGHPAHLLTHQAAVQAVEQLGEGAPALYTVSAIYPDHPRPRLANKDDPADLVIDIRSVLGSKVAAAECHRTQHDLFTRKTAEEVGHPVTVEEAVRRNPYESLHRVIPKAGNAEFEKLLEPYQKRA